MKLKVYVFVFNDFSDWKIPYAIIERNISDENEVYRL